MKPFITSLSVPRLVHLFIDIMHEKILIRHLSNIIDIPKFGHIVWNLRSNWVPSLFLIQLQPSLAWTADLFIFYLTLAKFI